MKNFLHRLICILAIPIASLTNLHAQSIESITIDPANPTTADPITVFVTCMFTSSGCDPYTQSVFPSGNNIYATALHCFGNLTAICHYTDTFEIGPLTAGNYTFYFTLNAGIAPAPCTPGIVPYDDDSITFTVATATGISNLNDRLNFSMVPNPSSGRFDVLADGLSDATALYQLHIVSITGSELQVVMLYGPLTQIISDLPAGIYFCYVSDKGNRSSLQKLVIGK